MKTMKGLAMSLILLSLVACFLQPAPSTAQDYPRGNVQLVVPFPPGGATDIFWRTLGDYLSKNMKTSIAIVNKTGGGGIVGMSTVVNSKPDGYTLCAGNSDTLNITPLFTSDIPFDTINDLTLPSLRFFRKAWQPGQSLNSNRWRISLPSPGPIRRN
jgi:tripartite-type tricarboxylate transporter receptor subunit TctC